ncbi:MAG: hypothetical protein QM740_21365 [Acidovorax sp.]
MKSSFQPFLWVVIACLVAGCDNQTRPDVQTATPAQSDQPVNQTPQRLATSSTAPASYALAVECAAAAQGIDMLMERFMPEMHARSSRFWGSMQASARHAAMVARGDKSPDQVNDEILSSMGAMTGGFEGRLDIIDKYCRSFADKNLADNFLNGKPSK